MTTEIRSATLRDVPAIHELLSGIIEEGGLLMSVRSPELPHFVRFIDANLRWGAPVMVACRKDRVVGWCDLYPRGQDVQRHVGRLGMGLARPHRGRGIGGALLDKTIDAAWHAGFLRLELEVFAHNVPAVALYESRGFVREGFHRAVRRTLSAGRVMYNDSLSMALLHQTLP